MLVEISVAVNYILSHLYSKLPRRRVDSFGEELEKYLCVKFQHHWYPSEPARESNFRCLSASGSYVDPLFSESAAVSGLDWNEIQACLPDKLLLNVDPGYVACQYQQSIHTNYEHTRYPSNPQWPSCTSLSSSGCSSASSNSSTNLAPTSVQMTHQVLYCVQEGWIGNGEKQWHEVTCCNPKVEQEPVDQVATAAALSVLVDAEDPASSDVDSRYVQSDKPLLATQNLWSGVIPKPESFDTGVELQANDTGFNSMESSKLELFNGHDVEQFNTTLPWVASEKEHENGMFSPFVADLTGCTQPNAPPIKAEGAHALTFMNKSASELQYTEKLNPNSPRGTSTFGNTNSWEGTNLPQFQPRFEQQVNPLFHIPQVRLSSMYSTTAITNPVNPFVQKSTSTPSFTAATFAQTKFGSTKLKNHVKRAPNRILSPTATSQYIPAVTRESVLSTILGANQRVPAMSNADLLAVRRIPPVILDTGFNHLNTKQTVPYEVPYSVDCNNLMLGPEEFSNPPSDSSSGSNDRRHLSFGAQPQRTLNAIGVRPPTTLNHFYVDPLENGFKSVSNECTRWQPTLRQFCHEGTGCFHDKLAPTPGWTQVSSLPITEQDMWDQIKPELSFASSLNTNDSEVTKRDQVSGLAEDTLLSARMVKLLLEDDNTSDTVGAELDHNVSKGATINQLSEQKSMNTCSEESTAVTHDGPSFAAGGGSLICDGTPCLSTTVAQLAGATLE